MIYPPGPSVLLYVENFLLFYGWVIFHYMYIISHLYPFVCSPWKDSYDQPRQHIKKQRHHFVNKGPSSQGYGFSSGHVWMWELDYKESWAPKNCCFWTMVLEKTLESPLDWKDFKQVNLKGQSWVFIGRTDAETEVPVLWLPDVKSQLNGEDPDVGKDLRQ